MLNTKRIIGLVAILIGAGLFFLPENDIKDFISGILIGLGIGLALTAKNRKAKI